MKPLTIEQIKALQVGDWVWITDEKSNGGCYARKESALYGEEETEFCFETIEVYDTYFYDDYGTTWLAYKNKEQAEGEYDSQAVENEVLKRDIENYERMIEEISTALYGANIIIDADGNIHDKRVEQAKKQTAKEILQDLYTNIKICGDYEKEQDKYKCYSNMYYNCVNFIEQIAKDYGVEIDNERV